MPRGKRATVPEVVAQPASEETKVEETEDETPALAPKKRKSSTQEVTYNGTRADGRNPVCITVIVPSDGTKPDDANAIISEGLTLTLKIGQSVTVPTEAAAWLRKHPAYDIS